MLLGDLSLVGDTSKAAGEFKWGRHGHASLSNSFILKHSQIFLPPQKIFFFCLKNNLCYF